MRLPDDFQKRLDEHMKQVPRVESLDSILDICFQLREAEKYAQCDEETFRADDEKQAAIMYRLLCAGEAAKQFCDLHEGKNRRTKSRLEQPNEDIEKVAIDQDQWRALHKLRDYLAHNPRNPDVAFVWHFVKDDVPPLMPAFKRIVTHYKPEQLIDHRNPTRTRAIEFIFGEFVAAFEAAVGDLEGALKRFELRHPGVVDEARKLRQVQADIESTPVD